MPQTSECGDLAIRVTSGPRWVGDSFQNVLLLLLRKEKEMWQSSQWLLMLLPRRNCHFPSCFMVQGRTHSHVHLYSKVRKSSPTMRWKGKGNFVSSPSDYHSYWKVALSLICLNSRLYPGSCFLKNHSVSAQILVNPVFFWKTVFQLLIG